MANTVKLDSVCPSVYGISVRRYQQLAKEGLVPSPADGLIDFVASTKALITYYQKLLQGQGSITLTDERARLTKVQADIAILEYEKTTGQLLEKDEVISAWKAMIMACRSRLLSIPTKAAPLIEGLNKRESQHVLEKMVWEALNELSNSSKLSPKKRKKKFLKKVNLKRKNVTPKSKKKTSRKVGQKRKPNN
ncbi:MAG: hypothetical protein KKH94_11420 [Candidatus Omnitrophica bacterium]|nr:hypothetical protein [Candidatus Omnitrophota bacterium]